MKEIFKSIFYKILLFKIKFESLSSKKKVYIMGTPLYGNLGDQAIIYSEELLFKNNFKNYKVIEVESSLVLKYTKQLRKIVGNNDIFITGGGFLGSLWMNEELMFRTVLETFKDNRIVVFPHTFFFDNTDILNESIKIYSKHKDLHIFCRENYSFDFMKNNFKKCNVYLAPDMVLYMDVDFYNESKDIVLLCLRNDKEKTYDKRDLLEYLKSNDIKYEVTDTVIKGKVFKSFRKISLKKILSKFKNKKIVITDRLHGMIFCYLTNTPCLVLESKSYKTKGVYEWIKKSNNIKFVNKESLIEELNKRLNNSNNEGNNSFELDKDNYKTLLNVIRKVDE